MSEALRPLRSRTCTEDHNLCLLLKERLHEMGRFILGKKGNTQKLWKTRNFKMCKRTPQKTKEQAYPYVSHPSENRTRLCFWSSKTLSKALPTHMQLFLTKEPLCFPDQFSNFPSSVSGLKRSPKGSFCQINVNVILNQDRLY